MWGVLGIFSAVLLGIYDVFKKTSLNNNAVLPVLFFSILSSAFIFAVAIIGSALAPNVFQSLHLYVPPLTTWEHIRIFIKALIVLSSWILAFFAIKHLPLSMVSPIRATAPLWTLLGALLLFHEKLNALQWAGLITTLFFFFLFSTTGKREGIRFSRNKWIFLIIGATLLGSASSLYDKYIIRAIDRLAVQSWTGIYQLALMLGVTGLLWYPSRKKHTPFQWKWTIPLIGLFLTLSDFFYFYALSNPESLIAILSGIRRSGVVIPFIFAALFLKEKNVKQKGIYLVGIIFGVTLMALGSR
ncbi:MAG TPA: EamA family transporter [Prolixibacteraceae bacterium]|nr:EamA family transporter [Prolixibacteraceae bacterium]